MSGPECDWCKADDEDMDVYHWSPNFLCEHCSAIAASGRELLAALKLCKQALKNYIDSGYGEDEDQEAYAAAMAALGKAEGRCE